jgi:hypothetical protein
MIDMTAIDELPRLDLINKIDGGPFKGRRPKSDVPVSTTFLFEG